MKKLLFCVLILLLLAAPVWAQNQSSGAIEASGSTCATARVCVQLGLPTEAGSATVLITGTYSATLQFEASANGTTYVSITGYPLASGAGVTSTTSTGTWQFSVGGFRFIRARASAYTSGSAAVTITGSAGAYTPASSSSVTGTVTANQGTAGATAWPTQPIPFGLTRAQGVSTAITDTTSTAVIAGTSLNYLYLQECSAANTSASVGTLVNFQDAVGGATLFQLYAPAGLGHQKSFPFLLKVPTVGNGLACAPVTTGASVTCSCSGFKSTGAY